VNSDADLQRRWRRRVLLFLAAVFVVFVVLPVAWQFVATLGQLDVVEAERDQWQRPADVLAALDSHAGSRVLDLGCGSGYFALKLARGVGPSGEVIAEDIRWLPLVFLRVRAMLRGDRNVDIVHGTLDDPRLPAASADGVLIANTYHELDHPAAILACVRRALKPGGRLVILDRGPDATPEPHHIARRLVEDQVRCAGFEIIDRNDRFISNHDDDRWWLLIARRP